MLNLVLDREHTRLIDKIAIDEYGMSGLVLMENAGRGCVEQLLKSRPIGAVVVCCGPGNNGGDGLVIARHLAIAAVPVRVLLSAERESLSAHARHNLDILSKTSVLIQHKPEITVRDLMGDDPVQKPAAPIWVVDALLGTGFQGAVRPPLDRWIAAINATPFRRLAVDIPSGLDCDTGHSIGECIRADVTCTFVALKPCFGTEPGRTLSGKVIVVEIGVPPEIIRQVAERQGRRPSRLAP